MNWSTMKVTLISVFFACAATCPAAVTRYDADIIDTYSWTGDLRPMFIVGTGWSIGVHISSGLPNTFTFEDPLLADAFSLFEVQSGNEFNADYVNSQPSFMNNSMNPGTGTFFLSLGQSKFLAYWLQPGVPVGTALDSDIFGWALFTNIGGELVVSDSATADSGGIIVGTLEQIPEPSGATMCFVGVGASLLRRRRI